MYIRIKRFHKAASIKTYYYVVEGVREADQTRQRVVKYLGTVQSIMEKVTFAERIMKKEKHFKLMTKTEEEHG